MRTPRLSFKRDYFTKAVVAECSGKHRMPLTRKSAAREDDTSWFMYCMAQAWERSLLPRLYFKRDSVAVLVQPLRVPT